MTTSSPGFTKACTVAKMAATKTFIHVNPEFSRQKQARVSPVQPSVAPTVTTTSFSGSTSRLYLGTMAFERAKKKESQVRNPNTQTSRPGQTIDKSQVSLAPGILAQHRGARDSPRGGILNELWDLERGESLVKTKIYEDFSRSESQKKSPFFQGKSVPDQD